MVDEGPAVAQRCPPPCNSRNPVRPRSPTVLSPTDTGVLPGRISPFGTRIERKNLARGATFRKGPPLLFALKAVKRGLVHPPAI